MWEITNPNAFSGVLLVPVANYGRETGSGQRVAKGLCNPLQNYM